MSNALECPFFAERITMRSEMIWEYVCMYMHVHHAQECNHAYEGTMMSLWNIMLASFAALTCMCS